MGAAGSLALKTAQMSGLFGGFVEGEGVAYLETAQVRFRVSFPETRTVAMLARRPENR